MNSWLDRIALDHDSPIPLYHQVATHLEQTIASGELVTGSKLQNEVWLAGEFGVSRPTMRAALRELVDKGLVVRRRGIGTVVTGSEPVRRTLALSSLFEDLQKAGHHPTTHVLRVEREPADSTVAGALGLDDGTLVVAVERVRFADAEPVAWMRNYLPADVGDFDEADLASGSLYALLRSRGIRPAVTHQTLGAEPADAHAAELLRMRKGAPVLIATRRTHDQAGRAIEYAVHRYRAESYSFEMTLMG